LRSVRFTAYSAPSSLEMTLITLQKPPRPTTPRSTKSRRRRDMVAYAAAFEVPFAGALRPCAGTSAGCSSAGRNGLRAHGGDCAARGIEARPAAPGGALGAGTRKTDSGAAPPLHSPRSARDDAQGCDEPFGGGARP
jgi:hypothetical protein